MRPWFDALQAHACDAMVPAEPAPDAEAQQRQQTAVGSAVHLAIPRRGHVISSVAELYGSSIREAVAFLSASIARAPRPDTASTLYALRRSDYGSQVNRSDAEIAAWSIVSIWVAGVATKAICVSASLLDAGEWFFGGKADNRLLALASPRAVEKAVSALRSQACATAYLQLLPYILDPHGPGSRLSVRRDPSTRAARSRKREDGVFYTPADVADYMADACVSALGGDIPTVLDPACGTGVFLRAALHALRRYYPEKDGTALASESLFGADIDPLALDATAFVLLADVWLGDFLHHQSPVALWQRMRRNLSCIDTLRIDPAEGKPLSQIQADAGRIPLSSLFAGLRRGPMIFLGNPPYANLGVRSDLGALQGLFQTIAVKPQPNAEIYLAFIEQMVRLADGKACAGALVLPLSIACNLGSQFTAARKIIAETPGQWRFAFFDREPHALFGEDVKTRNAIVLWSRSSCE